MTYKELTIRLAVQSDLSQAAAGRLLKTLNEEVAAALARGEPVHLGPSGTLRVVERAPRQGTAPNGTTYAKPASRTVRFTPSLALKSRLNAG